MAWSNPRLASPIQKFISQTLRPIVMYKKTGSRREGESRDRMVPGSNTNVTIIKVYSWTRWVRPGIIG